MRKSVKSLEEWTDAFILYSYIYQNKYPSANLAMLKYMFIIRDAATKYPGMAWKTYDEQFKGSDKATRELDNHGAH